jgi:hypothetical protein
MYGEKRNAYRILMGKPEGKRPLGRPRRKGRMHQHMNQQNSKKKKTTLQHLLNLPYTYNVCSSNQLMTELKTIELNSNIRMCSFDIKICIQTYQENTL